MPIEIRELNIKIQVRDEESSPSLDQDYAFLKREIEKACKKEVQRQIKRSRLK